MSRDSTGKGGGGEGGGSEEGAPTCLSTSLLTLSMLSRLRLLPLPLPPLAACCLTAVRCHWCKIQTARNAKRACLLPLPKFSCGTRGDLASSAAQRPGEKTGDSGLRGEMILDDLEEDGAGARWLRRVDFMASSCSTISAAEL